MSQTYSFSASARDTNCNLYTGMRLNVQHST